MTRNRLPIIVALALLTAIALPLLPLSAQSTPVPVPRLLPRITGLQQPTYLTHAGDGSGRLFVLEKRGVIRVVDAGVLLPEPFLDISARVLSGGAEQGLFSLAFPPGGAAHFYVDYTAQPDGRTIVSRYEIASDDPNRADPTTERVVLSVPQPFANHNGGQIAFGPDGYLYVGMGDGGEAGDPEGNAQNPATLLGKVLRLDVDSPPEGEPYGIPATNPFTTTAGYRPEIWSLGLRNPWRFSFDRTTGDLFIADVGQSTREEVNYQPASDGADNYGWDIMEGSSCYAADSCDATGLTLPVAEYGHDQGNSITGGYVYRAEWPAAWQGLYFYGDFGSGRIWTLARESDTWVSRALIDTPLLIASFGEDESGRLYVLDYAGSVFALAPPVYLPLIVRAW